MKNMKKLVSLLLVVVLVMGLAACGKKEENKANPTEAPKATEAPAATETPADPEPTDEPAEQPPVATAEDVTLLVWGPQEEQDLLKTMCANFQALHPEWNITFNYGVCGEDEARTELMKDPEAGADVFYFAGDQIYTLYENGILCPITIGADEIIAHNGTAATAVATFDDLLCAVPMTTNTWFMYYDKSKYSEEDVKSLNTMMAKDLGEGVYNACMGTSAWYTGTFFWATGCEMFGPLGNDPTICEFNTDKGLLAGKYMLDFFTNPKFLKEADGNGIALLKEGKCGAIFSGTWDAVTVQEALGDNYAATCLPSITIDGQDYQLNSMGNYKYIGANMNADNPLAAVSLAAYLGGEECQKLRFEVRSYGPTWDTLASDPAVLENVAIAASALQAPLIHVQPTISAVDNFWTPLDAFVNGIINGEITEANLQESLDKLNGQVLGTIAY